VLLTIFIFLVSFSLILIIGGYYIDAPVTQIAGTAVMFVTGLLLMFSSVEYPIGEISDTLYEYGNNFTDYHWDSYTPGDDPVFNPSDDAVFLFHIYTNTSTTFSTWDEEEILGVKTRHTVSFLLLVTSILILVSVLTQRTESLGDRDE